MKACKLLYIVSFNYILTENIVIVKMAIYLRIKNLKTPWQTCFVFYNEFFDSCRGGNYIGYIPPRKRSFFLRKDNGK